MSDVEKILLLIILAGELILINLTRDRTLRIEDRLDRIERIKDVK